MGGELASSSSTTVAAIDSEQQEHRRLPNYDYPVYKPPKHEPKCDPSPYCKGYNCCPSYHQEPNCYEVCYETTTRGYGGKGGKGGKGGYYGGGFRGFGYGGKGGKGGYNYGG